MKIAAWGILIALAGGLAADDRTDTTVSLSMWAIQASSEGRETKFFDAAVAPIRGSLSDLPFDTYRTLETRRLHIPYGNESQTYLTDNYKLIVRPISKEEDGRIRLNLCVEIPPKDPRRTPVKAIDTRLLLAPNQKIKVGGLQLEQGELVIVLARD